MKKSTSFWRVVRDVSGRILTLFLALILLFNLANALIRAFTNKSYSTLLGITTAIVVSGSMEPALNVDDFVVIVKQSSYEVGDIISFSPDGKSLVTHRLVERYKDEFTTKGDANNKKDDAISKNDVVGKVCLVIPGVGKFTQFLQTPLGLLCITLLGVVFLVIPSFWERKSKKDEETNP